MKVVLLIIGSLSLTNILCIVSHPAVTGLRGLGLIGTTLILSPHLVLEFAPSTTVIQCIQPNSTPQVDPQNNLKMNPFDEFDHIDPFDASDPFDLLPPPLPPPSSLPPPLPNAPTLLALPPLEKPFLRLFRLWLSHVAMPSLMAKARRPRVGVVRCIFRVIEGPQFDVIQQIKCVILNLVAWDANSVSLVLNH